jgi:hypothetical protein
MEGSVELTEARANVKAATAAVEAAVKGDDTDAVIAGHERLKEARAAMEDLPVKIRERVKAERKAKQEAEESAAETETNDDNENDE